MDETLVFVAVCIVAVAARPQSIVTSDMSLDMLPAQELDIVLDELHHKHLTNIYNDYEEVIKKHEIHKRKIFHEHQRKRRKRHLADHQGHDQLYEVNFANHGKMAHASSSHPQNPARNAFGETGFWYSAPPYTVPQTLWLEFYEPIRIVKYSFTSRTDDKKYIDTDGASKYIFWASNWPDCKNESHRVILHKDYSGKPFTKNNVPKSEIVKNHKFYSCYGFTVTDVPGRDGLKPVTFANIHLYSDIELNEVSIEARGGIAKSSSSHEDGTNPPMNAFGDSGFWQSSAPYTVPQSLWAEFPEPIRIVKYSFTSRTDNINYIATDGPSKYIFWASNSNNCKEESQWMILSNVTSGTPFAKSNDPKIELVENNNLYRCYGFKVTDVPGRAGIKPVALAKIHLYTTLDQVGRDVTKSNAFFKDVWHNFIVDTGINNRQVVVIDDIKKKEFEVGDEIKIEKAFPLHFYHLGMPALFKSEDSLGYIINNKNQNLTSLLVQNEFTVSRSGCRCTKAKEKDPKSCACCSLGGCLCDIYGIKDTCVQCGKERTCFTKGHQKLRLESATGFTYHLDSSDPEKGYKTMFAITLDSDVKFYTWDDGFLKHKRIEDGRTSLSFGSDISQIAYADTFIDYKGDLIKKRFLFTFERGIYGKQLYHELEIDPQTDTLRILSTRVWKVTGEYMKTIQTGGHIYILLCDYDLEINLYDFRADKYRNFDPWFIHKFKLDAPPLEIEVFTSHFEQFLLITTAHEARIYTIKGNTFEHLQSLKPESPITKFENIVPMKLKGCGSHEVLLAVEGTDAVPYVWNGYNENYTMLSERSVPSEIHWSQAVSLSKHENAGEVFIPGKSNVFRLDITGHLEELPDPTIVLYEKVNKHLEKVEVEFDHQKKIIDETLDVISKSIHNSSIIHGTITLDNTDIDFKGALHTNGFNALEIMIDESLAGRRMTNGEYKAKLQQLKEDMDQLNKTVLEHGMVLLEAVPKTEVASIKIKGTKRIKNGNVTIPDLKVRDLSVTQALYNNVEFPLHKKVEDMIRRNYPGSVKGLKTFSTNSTISRLLTDFLDDIPVSDLVTRDGNETIEGAVYKKGLAVKENIAFSEGATAAGKNPNEIVCSTNRVHKLGTCRFNNILSVQGDLPVVSGNVGGVDINKLAHNTLKKNSPSVLNKLLNITNFIIVEGNIVTNSVMGVNFTEFLENAVFKNKPSNISGHLTYESDVTIQESLLVHGLINNKSFPSDYPLTSDSHIDFGNKSFEVLEADNVIVQGLVDERKPEHFFTKTTNQTVNDTKSFDRGIDVIGDLDVSTGMIDGLNISNLRLINDMDYTEIRTIVFKKNLEVESLNFTEYLNGFDFNEAVNDLVFCDEDVAIIDSVKSFNNLAVRYVDFHSSVNNENIANFVTTDKDQVINGNITFNEVTHFRRLDVDGSVDGVDIKSLYGNALYLDKPEQKVMGTKTFSNNITMDSLEVYSGINGVDFTKVFTKSGVQNIDASQNFTNANFENIEIKNLHLKDSALIDGIDLDDFLKKRLSTVGAQSIQGNIVINCPVNGTTLHSERINGYDLDDLVKNLVVHDTTATINTGGIVFSSMEVLGPVKTKEQKGANGISLAKIDANAILLDGSSNDMNYAHFEHMEVNDLGINGLIDGINMESLINDAVLADDATNISITGNKTFTSMLNVLGDIDAVTVNGYNYSSQLLLKKWDQSITGHYSFEDVAAMKNVKLTGSFNQIDMEDFEDDAAKRENVIVEELEFAKVNVAARGGLAEASSSHESGNHPPQKAFEETGFWHSLYPYTVPQSLWVKFVEPGLKIVKYSFTSRTDNLDYVDTDGPSKYIFWASNHKYCHEEAHWVILHKDNSGTPFAKSNDPKIVTIDNDQVYRCYGFKVTDVPGRKDSTKPVAIANIHLYSLIEKVIVTQNGIENGTVKWMGTGNGTIGLMDVNGQFNNLTVFDVYDDAVCENTSEILGKIKLESSPEFGNLNIKTLNGTDFESVLSDVVFKNSNACIFENDLKIDGEISASDVNVNETNIKGKLDRTDYEKLFTEAIYLSKDHNITSHWTFVGGAVIAGNLGAEKLENIPLTDYLTGHTPQNISHNLRFDKLNTDNVNVLGTVNGLNLTEEFKNTLFGTGNEIVKGNKTLLGLIYVDGDVHTNQTGRQVKVDISEDTIGIQQQNEVFINGGLQFTGPLQVNDLSVNGSVNSINLDEMFTNAWYNDETTNLEAAMTFEGGVVMEGALSRNISDTEEYDIKGIYEKGNSLISRTKELVNIIHSNFSETCDSAVHLYKLMENSIYDADYLQFVTSFKSAGVHRSSTTFIMNGLNYVLVNWHNNCNSSIYRWDSDIKRLIFEREFESGFAYNWIVIPYADPSYVQLVMSAGSREVSHCSIQSTSIWDVEAAWDTKSNTTRISVKLAQTLLPSIGVSVMGANYNLKLNLYNDHDKEIMEYLSNENGDFQFKEKRKDEINKYVFGYDNYGSEIGFEVSISEKDSFQNTSTVNVFENGQLLSSHNLNYIILDALAIEQDGNVLLLLLLREPILDRAALAEDLYYTTVYQYDFDSLVFVLMSYENVHGSGSLETFTAGNDASRLVFVTLIQDHGPIIIYNLLGETMKVWTELPIYVPTWTLPFNIRQANGYDKPYLLLGWDDTQEVIILTMEMRGFTVPPYDENCYVPDRNMTLLHDYYHYINQTRLNSI